MPSHGKGPAMISYEILSADCEMRSCEMSFIFLFFSKLSLTIQFFNSILIPQFLYPEGLFPDDSSVIYSWNKLASLNSAVTVDILITEEGTEYSDERQ